MTRELYKSDFTDDKGLQFDEFLKSLGLNAKVFGLPKEMIVFDIKNYI